MNKPVSIREIVSIIKNIIKKEIPGTDCFTGELYQIFKKEMISVICNLFAENNTKIALPNSYNDQHYTTRKKKKNLETNIFHEYRCKILYKMLANQIQKYML